MSAAVLIFARRTAVCCASALACLSVCAAAGAQTGGAARVDENFGPVRYLREDDAVFVERRGRRFERGRRISSVETFDRSGRQLTYTAYKDDGGVLYGDSHSYDASGRLVETKTEHSRFTHLPDRCVYLYDPRGLLAEKKCFDAQGGPLGGYLYKYDEGGRVVERKSYRLGDSRLYFNRHLTRYRHDAEGRLAEESSFVYDGAGEKPDEFGVGYHKQLISYDAAGRPSVTRYLRLDGTLARVETTSYDRRNNTTGVVTRGPGGELLGRVRYAYVFDARGNWVRQTRTEWAAEGHGSVFGELEVTYRTIRYFPESPPRRAKRASVPSAPARGRRLN